MSLHQHIEYEYEFGDKEKAGEIFDKFLMETNASKNAAYYDYLLTYERGNYYVNELGEMSGVVNGRRALVTEDNVIEGVLEESSAEELKRRYEELRG